MNDSGVALLYVVGIIVGFVLLYVIIRFAAQQGVTAALRRHEAWMRDGSLDAYLDRHAELLAARTDKEARDRAELARQRPPS